MTGPVNTETLSSGELDRLRARVCELEASEAHWRSLVDVVSDFIVLVDTDGTIQYINRTTDGRNTDEAIGQSAFDFVVPEDRTRLSDLCKRVMQSGQPMQTEIQVRVLSGKMVWFDVRVAPRNSQGTSGVVMSATNITERKRAEEDLRGSEENYRTIFNAANDMIFVHDAETGAILDVNEKVQDVFGYSSDDIRQMNVSDFTAHAHPLTQTEVCNWVRKAAAEGPQIFEWQIHHKDGYLMWVEVNLKKAVIGGNDRVLAVVRDITERKEAAEALRHSETTYREIFNSASDMIVVHDIETGRILDANDRFLAVRGLTRNDLPGLDFSIYGTGQSPYTEADVREWVRKAVEEGPQLFEWGYERGDRKGWVETHLKKAEIRGRECLLAVVRDITERKQTIEALRESEERVRSLLEAVFDGILIHEGGKALDVNPAFAEMFGYEQSEMIGMDAFQTVAPESMETMRENVQSGYEKPYEVTLLRKDGSRFYGEILARNCQYHGRTVRVAAIRNITERKQADEALRQAHDELEQRVAERTEELSRLNKDLAREIAEQQRLEKEILEISERERKRIGHDLHDELGQQLTGIAYMCKVLEQKLATAKSTEAADAGRIANLIQHAIKQTSGLARGLYPVDLESGGLTSALEDLAANTENLTGISCDYDCREPVPIADPAMATHLYRLAQEAVNNAVKHAEASRIGIFLDKVGDRFTMSIQDDGLGIPKELADDSEKQGMGWRIMEYRAKVVGGELEIRRVKSGGTHVSCTFPVSPGASEDSHGRQ